MNDKPAKKRPPRKDGVTRQGRHRKRMLAGGGRFLTVELDADAVKNLDTVQTRDGIPTARRAVEESLEFNAAEGPPKRRKPSP